MQSRPIFSLTLGHRARCLLAFSRVLLTCRREFVIAGVLYNRKEGIVQFGIVFVLCIFQSLYLYNLSFSLCIMFSLRPSFNKGVGLKKEQAYNRRFSSIRQKRVTSTKKRTLLFVNYCKYMNIYGLLFIYPPLIVLKKMMKDLRSGFVKIT